MKAVVWNKYGPPQVLKLKEVEKPVPEDDEVLIKIHTSTVTLGDCEVRSLDFIFTIRIIMRFVFGFFKPRERILGQELAGTIEAVGSSVKDFKAGDAVIATPGMKFGGYAEYVTLKAVRKEGVLVKKPESLSFEEAAALPVGSLEALNFVGNSHLKKGESILINGAGGSIGTMAIQMAKHEGAVVTAVDRADKLDFLKQVGADHVIDYQTQDYTQLGQTYDVILDVVGKGHFGRTMKCFKDGGRYVIANPTVAYLLKAQLARFTSKTSIYMKMTAQHNDSMKKVLDLVKSGVLKVHIDQVLPLEKIVEAHEYVEAGNKRGNLVLRIKGSD